jgi:hypothetical protein
LGRTALICQILLNGSRLGKVHVVSVANSRFL